MFAKLEERLFFSLKFVSFSLYFRSVSIDGDTYMCTAFLQVKIFFFIFFSKTFEIKKTLSTGGKKFRCISVAIEF